uniref:Prominin 1 n=1 Tax=Gongylonema pulchrum TaxID=637853 RepID=A0A183CZX9_9BILA
LLSLLHSEAETLKAVDKASLKLTENDITQIKKYLSRTQEALEAVVDVVHQNADDLSVIETHLK